MKEEKPRAKDAKNAKAQRKANTVEAIAEALGDAEDFEKADARMRWGWGGQKAGRAQAVG